MTLPPPPKPDYQRLSDLQSGIDDYFRTATLLSYAESAVAAERERCAKILDARAARFEEVAQEIKGTDPDDSRSVLATAFQLSVAANLVRTDPNK